MGKNEFLTPKAIANRIKAKGLQKLRWYCQMCQKQCRDENGFKCHCMSEGHQRQMQVFGENPDRFIDGYSEEFEESFMEHLKRSHRFSRVAATVVWNEYIANRHHIHMNSTKWATLTDFVKYLGRIGKCKVDETPKGWFITFIDREPETLLKEGLKNKRARAELADEDRQEKVLAEQIERAVNSKPDKEQIEVEKTELFKQQGEKIGFSFATVSSKAAADTILQQTAAGKMTKSASIFEEGDDDSTLQPSKKWRKENSTKENETQGTSTILADMMREEEKAKEKVNRKDYWLCKDLVVKVMSQSLADKGYYKEKGVVERVISKYVGEIRMLESNHLLKVDQEELETVLPQIGGTVRIVNGAYRGSNARLLAIDTQKFAAKVQIENGAFDGRILPAIDYEDICKIMSSS
jgi:DNA/RNA-binding protein KIN17